MQDLEIHGRPWALQTGVLAALNDLAARNAGGEPLEVSVALLGLRGQDKPPRYTVDRGVAVLQLDGLVLPKPSLLSSLLGGIVSPAVSAELQRAAADRTVQGVVLAIDSPGGSVAGTAELAAELRRLSDSKPVAVVSDGQLSSAAYWIASAAGSVHVTGPTVSVGSIGVVATHRFAPSFAVRAGGKTTEITAGRYKRIASTAAPLTKDGEAYLQEQVDYVYRVFVQDVARYRGVSVQRVLDRMADGRTFIGQQAIDAGLADGRTSVGELIDRMAADPGAFRRKGATSPRSVMSAPGAPTGQVAQPPARLSATAAPARAFTPSQAAAGPSVPPTAMPVDITFHHAAAAAQPPARFSMHHGSTIDATELGQPVGPLRNLQVTAAERYALENKVDMVTALEAIQNRPELLRTLLPDAQANAAKTDEQKIAEAEAYAQKHGVDFAVALEKLGLSY